MTNRIYGSAETTVSSGVPGLDDILGGGFTHQRLYLADGDPGTGKTTLGLQFLLAGVAKDERVLYVTLSETRDELASVARSHGWSLDKIDLVELIPSEESLRPDAQYKMFHPSEVELSETTRRVLEEVDRIKPRRLVFDSLSEMRLIAQNPLRYRRQILALKQFFIGRDCTVLLLDDRTSSSSDLQLQSISHGVLTLEQRAPEYGAERRRMRITKIRGSKFRGGYHDFVIAKGGLRVFPRLIAAEHQTDYPDSMLSSGIPGLDALWGGGIDRGTSTLLMGPAGTGKSTLATLYAVETAKRGENVFMALFDEGPRTLRRRSASVGIALDEHVRAGRITIRPVDPAELSPGEFAHMIREAVEVGEAKVVIIDSLNGYLNAMPEERNLVIQLHEMLSYLGQQGVTTLLVVAQSGLLGNVRAPVDTSYLADSVLLMRYFEMQGAVKKSLAVVKKRGGRHEDTIRAFQISDKGVEVGEPLHDYHGVLSGLPMTADSSDASDR